MRKVAKSTLAKEDGKKRYFGPLVALVLVLPFAPELESNLIEKNGQCALVTISRWPGIAQGARSCLEQP